MSENYSITNKIKDIINGTSESERQRKSGMKGKIDKADDIFQFCLLLFGLGFWIVMILRMFL